jgi:NTE family protein
MRQSSMPGGCGLVLSGGGARGAYQAGVLRGIADVLGDEANHGPFRVLTGISAGAINATYAASGGARFGDAVTDLWDVWRHLRMENVVRTDFGSLTSLAMRWMVNLGIGPRASVKQPATHLIDASPLREFLREQIDTEAIRHHVRDGTLRGVAVTATSYASGTAITFFDAAPDVQPWARSARMGQRAPLAMEHVLASAAIPVLFPPVRVGGCWYGDGGVRMTAPLSPAIHLGSARVLAVGVRYQRPDDQVRELNEGNLMPEVTLADIGGTMLNAAFLDSLESDAERMTRINHTIALLNEDQRRRQPSPLHVLPLLVIRPSMDLGKLASDQLANFPGLLRHMLKGLGASEDSGGDLLSYLSFDPAYTVPLLELGRADAHAQRSAIEAFFAG